MDIDVAALLPLLGLFALGYFLWKLMFVFINIWAHRKSLDILNSYGGGDLRRDRAPRLFGRRR